MSDEIVRVPDLDMLHFKAKYLASERVDLRDRGRRVLTGTVSVWLLSMFVLALIAPVFLDSSIAVLGFVLITGAVAVVGFLEMLRQRRGWRRLELKRREVQRLIDVELEATSKSIERDQALMRVNETLIAAFRQEDRDELRETNFTRRVVLWSVVATGAAFSLQWFFVPVPANGSLFAATQIFTSAGFAISLLMFSVWLLILEPARVVSRAIPTMHRRGLERRQRQLTSAMPISGALTSADDLSCGGELTLSTPTGGLELDGEDH